MVPLTDRGRPDEISNGKDSHGEGDPGTLSKDTVFHLLQSGRRRAILRYLLDREGFEVVQMRDVAEAVAAWEHGKSVEQLLSDERQRVYISLYQSHLPKLAEQRIVEYNRSRGFIETTDLTAVLEPYLEDGLHAEGELTVDDTATGTGDDGEQPNLGTVISSLFD